MKTGATCVMLYLSRLIALMELLASFSNRAKCEEVLLFETGGE